MTLVTTLPGSAEGIPPPPPEAPAGVTDFPVAITGESGSQTGFTQVVSFHLPADSTEVYVGFWKYGPTHANPDVHWYDFGTYSAATGTGYEILDNGKTLKVYLVDGKDGDDDLTANGIVEDDGFPIIQNQAAPAPVPVPLSGPAKGLLALLMTLGGMFLLGRRKKKSVAG